MGDTQQQAPTGAGTKKPLSDLTKEELIDKCKHFLTLAQKAKAAKDGRPRMCRAVVPKLFQCADHLNYFSAPRSTKY